MSQSGGGILSEQAYAQGKMLNHAAWNGLLARRITPSDVDMFVESCGQFLFVELTRHHICFDHMSTGQRMALQRLSQLNGQHAVAIARHNVLAVSGSAIDTVNDIFAAGVYFNQGTQFVLLDGYGWIELVTRWAENPSDANKWLLGKVNGAQ